MAKHKTKKRSDKELYRSAIAAIAAGAIITAAALTILGFRSCGTDGPSPDGTVTTTTSSSATATTTSSTASSTNTTTVTTTTTTVPHTTTTAPPVNSSDYPDDGDWNMVLVNGWNPLAEETLADESNLSWYADGHYVDYRIIDALSDMLNDGAQYGLWVTSGYRSYSTQETLYGWEVAEWEAAGYSHEEALDLAATVVARPGTSEHHTGLAVDLLHSECWELEEYWEDSEAFDWLVNNCYKYGFILRYPKEKQDITGVIYEPWHYRYVGVEAATAIMKQGITLEEYLA